MPPGKIIPVDDGTSETLTQLVGRDLTAASHASGQLEMNVDPPMILFVHIFIINMEKVTHLPSIYKRTL